MRPITTLPYGLQQLMREAPLLRCAYLQTDELLVHRRYGEEARHIERMARDRLAREMGERVMERATVTTEYDTFARGLRYETEVIVMSEAELAVLLTRAAQEKR